MAPAAKRRKRAIVDSDSDDDNDHQQQNNKPRNTLKNFLFSSPDSKKQSPTSNKSAVTREEPTSPIPTRKRNTRANAAAAALKPKPSLATSSASTQSRLFKTSTKSPSTSPEKPRAQKKLKIEEKGKTADLLTLFSKQAQRSQTSSGGGGGTQSSSKSVSQYTLDDIISDPISEDDDVALHKAAVSSSIVGKASHKRFKETSQPGTTLNADAGLRFRKQQQPSKPPATDAGTDGGSRPWSERFAPTNLDELAVHKRKVADVRRWLEDVLAGRLRQRLLVLKGHSGTGKTTTVQLLAKELRCEVLEWRNPANSYGVGQGLYQSAASQFEEFLGRGGKFGQLDLEEETGGSSPPPRSTTATRTGQEVTQPERRIMLIEEFPNTFMRNSTGLTSFKNTILQYLAANTPPLARFGQAAVTEPITPVVIVISETLLTTTSAAADSFTAHRLLGPEILRHPGTGVIEFNPVAPSYITKALELVVQKEARKSGRRRTPGPLVLKQLGEIGDIRSAISSLEFLCVKGDDDAADWGAKVAFSKPKKGSAKAGVPALTQGEQDSLQLVSQRESTLGIFHAVGKVVYNKRAERSFAAGTPEARTETLPDYMAHLSRPKLSEVSVDTLMEETGTDIQTFISALHENYALSCESGPSDQYSSIDYINGCLDYLSDSDLLCPSWDKFFGSKGFGSGAGYQGKDSGSHILRQDEMAFQVAVRGLLFSLPSPVKRKTHPGGGGGDSFKMYYPTYLKIWREKEELEDLVDMWATKMLKGEDGVSSSDGGSGASMFTNNLSNVFRNRTTIPTRPGPSGVSSSVGDWATAGLNRRLPANTQNNNPSSSSTGNRQSTQDTSPPPLLSLGSSARQEMVLERLPYLAHIARRRRCSFGTMRIRDLDKIVSFQGIGPPKTENDSDVDDGQDDATILTGVEAWATDRPIEKGASPRKNRSGAITTRRWAGNEHDEDDGFSGGIISGIGDIQKLVLSDDDIEDD